MPQHPHYESMKLYLEDAAETETPWEGWEYKRPQATRWMGCTENPAWIPDIQYRRKQKTIRIGEIYVPAPETEKPERGQKYYYPDFEMDTLTNLDEWRNHDFDKTMLERGMLHLTEENARIHAEALIAVSTQKPKV